MHYFFFFSFFNIYSDFLISKIVAKRVVISHYFCKILFTQQTLDANSNNRINLVYLTVIYMQMT